MHAARVPPASLADVWAHVQPLLDRGLAVAGEATAEDMRPAIEDGRAQLWIAVRPGEMVAVALTEIRDTFRRRDLWACAGAGEGAAGVEALAPLLTAFAKAHGCQAIRFFGRRGWMRSGLLPRGTKHVADVLSLEV